MPRGSGSTVLVPTALAAWGSAALLLRLPSAALPAAIGCWGAVLALLTVALVAAVRRRRAGAEAAPGRSWLPAAVVVLAGAALAASAASAAVDARQSPALVDAIRGGHAVTVIATVDGMATTTSSGRGMVAVSASRLAVGTREWSVAAPLVVLGDELAIHRLLPGQRVQFAGTLRPADAGERAVALLTVRGDPRVLAQPPPALRAAAELRARFAKLAATLPGDGAALLPGLAIGDTGAVPASLAAAMRTASLSHLTAVSGANCAVVVALGVAVFAALGAPRWLRLLAGAALLGGFVVLVTPQPSVVRAAVMAALALVALGLGRPVAGLPLLCLAVIGLVVADPPIAGEAGFVLSVLATGGLLLLTRPIADRLERWLPRKLALVVAVPLAAQLACQPVLLLLNSSVPLYGVPANLLAEPAAPIATVLGLLACLLAGVAPPAGPAVATALAWIAWLPSSWIAGVAGFCAGLPGASLPWLPGVIGAGCFAALTVAALALLLGAVGRRMRAVCAGALVVVCVGYAAGLGGAAIASVTSAASRPGDWEVLMCDIGQGDSTIIRDSGKIALVDTGPKPERLRACLDGLGIHRIDLLILTHYDLDHVGGTSAVYGEVTRAYIGPSSGADDDRIAARLAASGARVDHGVIGTSGTLGRLDWRLLWPPPSGVEPGNPASLTMLVEPGAACPPNACLSALLLGDLGQIPQLRMLGSAQLGSPPLGHVDVVKVAHHGSADQAPETYEHIRAAVGLIGVGLGNDYGHPTAKLLDTLRSVGTVAARTDLEGQLAVSASGDGRVRLWTQRHPDSMPDGPAAARGSARAGAASDDSGTQTAALSPAVRAARPLSDPAIRLAQTEGCGCRPDQQRAAHSPQRETRARAPPFRSSAGTPCDQPRSCSSPARKPCSPTAQPACSATSSAPKTRASRSPTSMPPVTRRASW